MLINFFKSKKTMAIIALFLIFGIEVFLTLQELPVSNQAFHKWSLIDMSVLFSNPIWFYAIGFALILAQSVTILRSAYHQVVSEQSNYLSLFFYLSLTPVVFNQGEFGSAIIGLSVLTIVLRKLFYLYQVEKNYALVYDAALLLGIGSLFYLPILLFVFLIPLALWVYKIAFPRHIIISIFGISTPYLFYSVYLFWQDQFSWFWDCKFPNMFSFSIPNITSFTWQEISLWTGIALFGLMGAFNILRGLADRSIKQRKAYLLIMGLVLITITSAFLTDQSLAQHLILLCPAITFMFTDFFIQKRKKWVSDLMLCCYFGLLIINLI